jgi:hypothetical protein
MKSNHPILLRSAVAARELETAKQGAWSGFLGSTLRKMQSLLERWIIPAGVATFVTSGTALAADVTSTWKAASGDWSAPTTWTPKTNFPNNGNGGLTYDAVLGNDGTITLDRDITIQKYTQSNGTLTSSGNFTLTVNELMTWSGGTITGDGTIVANGGMDLNGADTKKLEYGLDPGRTLINNGTANLSGGNLLMTSDTFGGVTLTFTNNGIFNVAHEADIVMTNDGYGATPWFGNAATGVINKSGAATTTQIGVFFRNSGAINVNSGTLQISHIVQSIGGTFAVAAGATLDFNWTNPNYATLDAATSITAAGNVTFSEGQVNHSGSYVNSGTTHIVGGALSFMGTTPASIATLHLNGLGVLLGNGPVNVTNAIWTGGAMRGSGTTTITGTLTVSGPEMKTLGNGYQDGSRTLINNGTIDLSSGIGMESGSRMINNGIFNLAQGGAIGKSDLGGFPAPRFTNASTGIFNLNAETWWIGVPFTNNGTINVNSGTLNFNVSQFTQSAGSLNLLGGSISIPGTEPLIIQGGFLTGNGTIAAHVSITGGTIAPGNPAGAIAITGNLTLGNNSNLSIDLGGLVQGTQYDFLSEGGAVALTLDGTLTLKFVNGFQDAVTASESFTILTSNQTLLGAFDNVANGARLDVANFPGSFQVNYGVGSPFGTQNVVLSAFVIPEPSAALLLAMGCASLGLRRLPRSLRF